MLQRPRQCQVRQRHARLPGQLLQLLDQVELSGVARLFGIETFGHAAGAPAREGGLVAVAAVLPAQPAAVQRAPHDGAHAVALARGQHVALDGAHEDRVGRLLAAEALAAALLGRPLGLHDQVGRERGRADGPHLALVDEVGERAQRLVDVGRPVGTVHLVEIDPVGAEASEAVLARPDDVPSARAVGVGLRVRDERPGRHVEVALGGQDDLVAPAACEGLGDDLLALAGGVHVGGVDEVDAGVERLVDDADAVVVIGVAVAAEHHGAEARRGDAHAGTAEDAMGHDRTVPPPRVACRPSEGGRRDQGKCVGRRAVLRRGAALARWPALRVRLLRPCREALRHGRHHGGRRRGADTALGARLAARRADAHRVHARSPAPAARDRRHPRRARRPVGDRHLPRQRHGRRRQGPGLRRQLRLRPLRVPPRARCRGGAGRARTTTRQAGPRRSRRHGERGGRGPQVPQWDGHHA